MELVLVGSPSCNQLYPIPLCSVLRSLQMIRRQVSIILQTLVSFRMLRKLSMDQIVLIVENYQLSCSLAARVLLTNKSPKHAPPCPPATQEGLP